MAEPTSARSAGGNGDVAGAGRSGRLFDLRYLIGGLFTAYGVILTVASFFVSTEKSNGIDINLWLGLAMLALGVLFLAWAFTRPLVVEGSSAAAAATGGAEPRD